MDKPTVATTTAVLPRAFKSEAHGEPFPAGEASQPSPAVDTDDFAEKGDTGDRREGYEGYPRG